MMEKDIVSFMEEKRIMREDMIRRRIVFYGWVQGVGFRYRARHAASLYGSTGWVRNEWNGSVTMGSRANLSKSAV